MSSSNSITYQKNGFVSSAYPKKGAAEKNSGYAAITLVALASFALLSGLFFSFYFGKDLGNWQFLLLGSSALMSTVLFALSGAKKCSEERPKQKISDASLVFRVFYDEVANSSNDLKIAVDAVVKGDLTKLEQLLVSEKSYTFWEPIHQNYTVLELSALMVNVVEAMRGTGALISDEKLETQRKILVLLHQNYADYLLRNKASDKFTLQAEALFKAASLCIGDVEINGFFLPGCNDPKLQATFSKITKIYAPDCPHTFYVTKESLQNVDTLYNADQIMYAEWCHITALALKAALPAKSMDILMNIGKCSRYWLARVCHSPSANCYGNPRNQGEKVLILITSLNDPEYPRYHPWYQKNYDAWVENNDHTIFAVSPTCERIEGSTFSFFTFQKNGVEKGPYFAWRHGVKLTKLHELCQSWLEKIVDGDLEERKFEEAVGIFYHALCQYTPFERGSATFSLCLLAALLMEHEKTESLSQKAVTLMDCNALSLQAEDFLKDFFLSWYQQANS